MDNNSWSDLLALTNGDYTSQPPVGFIIDSPWIPGWYGIPILQYYAADGPWFESNLRAINQFPDVWFLPGFWAEYGMCTEPSAFGAKMIWLENTLPHAGRVAGGIEEATSLPLPNVRTDGLLPFVITRLKQNEPRIRAIGHSIRFAVTRGPLNIASFLMGAPEFMMSLAMNSGESKVFVERITAFVCDWIQYQKECFPSIDGILVLDDMIGFVGEDDFARFVIPFFDRIFRSIDVHVRFLHNDAQGLITAKHLGEMHVNMFNFSFEHPMEIIRDLAGPEVVLVGNIPPRDVMAAGTPGQVREAVRKAMRGIPDHTRILWSVGGGMPPGVKDANIAAFVHAVREFSFEKP